MMPHRTSLTGLGHLATVASLALAGCGEAGRTVLGDETAAAIPVVSSSVLVEHADAIRLSNGAVDVEIAPSVGRITGFGRTDGPDLLWRQTSAQVAQEQATDHYANWGGDKIWPALQSIWPRFVPSRTTWPPDQYIDGQPWELISSEPRQVVMRSVVNPVLQVQVTRRITLDDQQPQVSIHNTMTRVGRSVFPVTIWTVTQVQLPQYALMGVSSLRPPTEEAWMCWGLPEHFEGLIQVAQDDAAVRFEPPKGPESEGRKLGTLGQWVAGVWEDVIFLQRFAYDPAGAYPDRSNAQVYVDSRYMELETLSPQVHLQPGESIEHTVTWQLIDRPADADWTDVTHLITTTANGQP